VLEVRSMLLLVAPGAPLEEDMDDPEAPDVMEAIPELDVAGLVEDEVLLSLPLAPRHPEGACERYAGADDAAARPRSAFSRLVALKHPADKI
jgi:uncharacterized protein